MRANIKVSPFDWNDNLSELAQEDFEIIRKKLPYFAQQSIGLALAKLEMLEERPAGIGEVSLPGRNAPKMILVSIGGAV